MSKRIQEELDRYKTKKLSVYYVESHKPGVKAIEASMVVDMSSRTDANAPNK